MVTHRGENQSWKISLLTLFIFTGGNEVTGKREIILIHSFNGNIKRYFFLNQHNLLFVFLKIF